MIIKIAIGNRTKLDKDMGERALRVIKVNDGGFWYFVLEYGIISAFRRITAIR